MQKGQLEELAQFIDLKQIRWWRIPDSNRGPADYDSGDQWGRRAAPIKEIGAAAVQYFLQ
jgi:hypothetical protein